MGHIPLVVPLILELPELQNCLSVVVVFYRWLYLVIVGYQWLLLVISGSCWLSVVILGQQCLLLVISVYYW